MIKLRITGMCARLAALFVVADSFLDNYHILLAMLSNSLTLIQRLNQRKKVQILTSTLQELENLLSSKPQHDKPYSSL